MSDNTRNQEPNNIQPENLEAVTGIDQEPKQDKPIYKRQKANPDSRYNVQNLIIPTSKQAREIGRKGGQKSGEVRREQAKTRRTAQDILKAITEYKMTDDQIQAVIGDEGRAILGDDKAAYAVMLCRMMLQGMDGDTKAAQFVRDTIGDTLPTKTEASVEVITADDVQMIENARKALTG